MKQGRLCRKQVYPSLLNQRLILNHNTIISKTYITSTWYKTLILSIRRVTVPAHRYVSFKYAKMFPL